MRLPEYRPWVGLCLLALALAAEIALTMGVEGWRAASGGPSGFLFAGAVIMVLIWATVPRPPDDLS